MMSPEQSKRYEEECKRLNGENWNKYLEEMKPVLDVCKKRNEEITEKYMGLQLPGLDGEPLEERQERKELKQWFKERMGELREKYNIVFPDRKKYIDE